MTEIIVDEKNFDQEVLKSEIPVMLDFWAVWCGPCKVLSPIVEELANDFAGKLKVGKVNVDENNNLAMQFGVMSIPTLKFFKDGNVVGEIVGATPKNLIQAQIQKILG